MARVVFLAALYCSILTLGLRDGTLFVGSFSVPNVVDIAVLLMFGYAVARGRLRVHKWALYVAGALLALKGLSLAGSVAIGLPFQAKAVLSWARSVGLLVVIASLAQNEAFHRHILRAILCAAVLASGAFLVEYVTVSREMLANGWPVGEPIRLQDGAWTANPNDLGLLISVAVPFVLHQADRFAAEKRWWWHVALLCASAVSVAAGALTLSRTAWGLLAVGLLLHVVVARPVVRRAASIALVVAIAAVAVFAVDNLRVPPSMRSALKPVPASQAECGGAKSPNRSPNTTGSASLATALSTPVETGLAREVASRLSLDFQHEKALNWRLVLADAALELVAEHPFFGVGQANFPAMAFQIHQNPRLGTSENLYLGMAAESGVAFLLFWLGFVGFSLYRVCRFHWVNPLYRTAVLVTLIFLAGSMTIFTELFVWVYVLLGLLVAGVGEASPAGKPQELGR